MSNKLQELTEKLYNEGLSKGKEEGEQILAKAKEEAARITADAKAEAAAIVAAAEKEAGDLRKKVESDIKMASNQCLQATKKDIENLLVGGMTAGKVDKALADPEFIKELIKAVAGKFNTEEASELRLILPAALQEQLEPWVKNELDSALSAGASAEFTKKVNGGFKVGPKDGGWLVSLTDETFNELIAEYLRPVTRNLLFGKGE